MAENVPDIHTILMAYAEVGYEEFKQALDSYVSWKSDEAVHVAELMASLGLARAGRDEARAHVTSRVDLDPARVEQIVSKSMENAKRRSQARVTGRIGLA